MGSLSSLQKSEVLKLITVFPHIVSSLEYFPPLNSFPTFLRKLFKFSLHRRKTNAETIWIFWGFTISKKNSCCGNYLRRYGIYLCSYFKLMVFLFQKSCAQGYLIFFESASFPTPASSKIILISFGPIITILGISRNKSLKKYIDSYKEVSLLIGQLKYQQN